MPADRSRIQRVIARERVGSRPIATLVSGSSGYERFVSCACVTTSFGFLPSPPHSGSGGGDLELGLARSGVSRDVVRSIVEQMLVMIEDRR